MMLARSLRRAVPAADVAQRATRMLHTTAARAAAASAPPPPAAAAAPHPDGMSRYPGLRTARCQLRLLDYAGTMAFASSGGAAAAAAGMDALGAVVVGTVTAVGGGTIRDAVVLRKAPFWTEEVEYLYLAILSAAGTFFFWPREQGAPGTRGVPREYMAMQWADAAGVGAFAVIGAQNGVRARMPALVCLICGVSTATFGGAVRDVTLARPVRILHSHAELYASTAAAGAAAYLAARAAAAPVAVRIAFGVGTAVLGRWLSWTYGVRLPVWEALERAETDESGREADTAECGRVAETAVSQRQQG